jgi:tetratricopeptide (TPR) repeat protein
MKRAALTLALGFALAACGGRTVDAPTVAELPPANPLAVREFVAGVRLMARPGARAEAQARQRFEQALAIDPTLWEAHYDLGVLHRRARRFDDAITQFQAALAIVPGEEAPSLGLAEAYYAAGRRDEASEVLSRLVERGEGSIEARVALATIYREAERYDRALEQAREVLIRDPSHVGALLEVGRVYRARQQYDVAMLVFEKALALAGDARGSDGRQRALVLNEEGLLELDRGDTQAAFQAFGRATEADPRFTPARRNQGAVLLRAGDYQGAAQEYEAVLAVDEGDLDARVAYGVALRGLGEHRRARREYERVLRADPSHLGALFDLAVLRASFLDERPAARTMFQRFLELAPSGHPKRALAEQYMMEIEAELGAPPPDAPPPGDAEPGGDA